MAVSDSFTLAAVPDRGEESWATWAANSQASADFAPANLSSTVISKGWRSSGISFRNTGITCTFAHPVTGYTEIDSVSLVVKGSATSISQYSKWRVRADTSTAPGPIFETEPPLAVKAGYTNFTDNAAGTPPLPGEVDEGCDDADLDSTYAKNSSTNASDITFTFAAPGGTVDDSNGVVQEFRIRCKLNVAGTSRDVTVSLYENGVLVSALGTFSPNTDGTMGDYVFHWDASTVSDYSKVEMVINVAVDSIGGAKLVWIDAAEWNACIVPVVTADHDSGVLSVYDTFASKQFGDSALDDFNVGVNWLIKHQFGSTLNTRHIQIDLWENPSWATTTRDYIEIGKVSVGPDYVPTINGKLGYSIGVQDFSTVVRTEAGSTFVRLGARKRKCSVTLQQLPQAEMLQNIMFWIDLHLGVGAGVVVILEPNRTGVQTLQNFYGRVASISSNTDQGVGRMTRTLQLEEW